MQFPENEVLQCDISLSVSYMFHLMEAAGTCPRGIVIGRQPLHPQLDVGLTTLKAVARSKTVCSRVTLLKLQFLEDRRNPPDVAQEMCVDEAVPHVMIQRLKRTHRGLRIGRRLIKSFDNMSRFEELRIQALILQNITIDDLGRLYARLSQFSKIEIMCHERIYVDIFQMIR